MTLKRGKPLKRSGPPKRKAAARKKGRSEASRANDFPEDVKAAVRRRAGGWGNEQCEASNSCMNKPSQFHHRQLRRRGNNTLGNCLLVCAEHHTKIHSMGQAAYMHGLLVSKWVDVPDIDTIRLIRLD